MALTQKTVVYLEIKVILETPSIKSFEDEDEFESLVADFVADANYSVQSDTPYVKVLNTELMCYYKEPRTE